MTKGLGRRRQGRSGAGWRQVAPLVPVALFASAFAVQATTEDPAIATAALNASPVITTPEIVVPAKPFVAPVNVAVPGTLANGLPKDTQPTQVVSGLSRNGIPQAALKAYSRAQQLMSQADPGCHLPWTLVAAIGRVESNHGRFGGNVLNAAGKAVPGIYGLPLNGAGVARITDTDGGKLDGDATYDRAVGPMQFIPGTWSSVGTDADGDGTADPQDIDDAATASAVYLCAGDTDLADTGDLNAAVLRYNHSQSYVNLVLSIATAYAGGSWTAIENGRPEDSSQGIDRAITETTKPITDAPADPLGRRQQPDRTDATGPVDPAPSETSKPSGKPSSTAPSKPAPERPGDAEPTKPSSPPSSTSPTTPPSSTPGVPKSIGTTVTELAKATKYCQTQLDKAKADPTKPQLQKCIDAYVKGGQVAADQAIRDLLALLGLLGVLGGGIGGS